MSLCRHYVRELRRSVLVETPEYEKAPGSRSSSAVLDSMGDGYDPSGPVISHDAEDRTPDQRLSAFLRKERAAARTHRSPHGSVDSVRIQPNPSSEQRRRRPSLMETMPNGRNNSGSPAHTVARPDIRASAEKVLYTYLLPGSEREIVLPDSIIARVTSSIEEHSRDDPEVFDAAKDYVFQAMERDAFPGFLRAKALSNLVPPSIMLRLILGLLGMFAGFWTAFVLIFLNRSHSNRLWVCLILTLISLFLVFFFVLKLSFIDGSSRLIIVTIVHAFSLASYPIWPRRLRSRLPSIRPRSHHGIFGVQRVHIFDLLSHPRTVRAYPSQQTRSDGLGPHHPRRCRFDLVVRLGSREEVVVVRNATSRCIPGFNLIKEFHLFPIIL